MSEVNQETQGNPSIGVFPTPQGIAIEVSDGNNKSQLLMTPDDASRVAINLITNIVMFQMNNAMRAAAERAEIEKMRDLITRGANPDVPILKKK